MNPPVQPPSAHMAMSVPMTLWLPSADGRAAAGQGAASPHHHAMAMAWMRDASGHIVPVAASLQHLASPIPSLVTAEQLLKLREVGVGAPPPPMPHLGFAPHLPWSAQHVAHLASVEQHLRQQRAEAIRHHFAAAAQMPFLGQAPPSSPSLSGLGRTSSASVSASVEHPPLVGFSSSSSLSSTSTTTSTTSTSTGASLSGSPKQAPSASVLGLTQTQTSAPAPRPAPRRARSSSSAPGSKPRRKRRRFGRWTVSEHQRFVDAVTKHGHGAWDEITEAVGTRTLLQIRSHHQKWSRAVKLNKPFTSLEDDGDGKPVRGGVKGVVVVVGGGAAAAEAESEAAVAPADPEPEHSEDEQAEEEDSGDVDAASGDEAQAQPDP